MNKGAKITIISVAASLAAVFLTILLLCVPMGSKDAVLSMRVLYVTGFAIAALFLIGAIVSLIYRFRELTSARSKYYDNSNSIDEVDK